MNDELAIIEKQFADLRAAEYRAKGCQVLRDVPLEFLPGYRADMVVKSGSETKVVEVKTRPSLAAYPAFQEFKRIINSRPGWSYELLLVGEPEGVASAEDARPLGETDVLHRLAQAKGALDAGINEAALLLAWAAAEAVVRMLVAAEGIAVARATNPSYILGMAVAHGAIGRDDYHRLLNIMEYRNAIAHGFAVNDRADALATELIAAVRALLRECREPDTIGAPPE